MVKSENSSLFLKRIPLTNIITLSVYGVLLSLPGGGEAGEGEHVAPAPGRREHRRLAQLEQLRLLPREDGVAVAREPRVRRHHHEVGSYFLGQVI